MPYVVIEHFFDLVDQKHEYRTGETYPRSGFSVSDARIKELMSANNRLHMPLIAEQAEEGTKEAISDAPAVSDEEVTKKTRKRRKRTEKGLENGNDIE